MNFRLIIALLSIVCITVLTGWQGDQHFDRSAYYSAIASKELEKLNSQLEVLKEASVKDKEGFEGALLMKKAGLISGPKKKLDMFKSGHDKLESVLSKDTSNTELRFLRLIIQENAPRILKYRKEIAKDSQNIRKNYKNLPPAVQQAIVNYSKTSKVLKPAYF
jgi:hypothetical protein